MSSTQTSYGHTIENPILVNDIQTSMDYLRNLVTDKGFHILFHRYSSISTGKGKPIDRYELITGDGRYDDLYISVYNEENKFIPPQGYLFESAHITWEFDEPPIDKKYVFVNELEFHDFEALQKRNSSLPIIERVVSESYGVNSRVKNFPYDVIDEAMDHSILKIIGIKDKKDFFSLIPPRKT
jgi:hypothetical protein